MEKMTEDQQATEDYYRALGWEWREWEGEIDFLDTKIAGTLCGYFKDGKRVAEKLPDICQSYPDFKREVLERMEREGYRFSIDNKGWACWTFFNPRMPTADTNIIIEKYDCKGEPIKDNEILRAAVVAATRFLEEEK